MLLVDIKKSLGDFHLSVKFTTDRETFALLGPSGCGKSATLRCIAGIDTPDEGRIVLDGVPLFDKEKRINLPPRQRGIGLLQQAHCLFPNKTVWQNISVGADGDTEEITRLLQRFELEQIKDLYPHQISWGQSQRTSLARMLAARPKAVLLDEPFSALDAAMRYRVLREMKEMLQDFSGSIVFVSHNRDEVFSMASRGAVLWKGKMQPSGGVRELFESPPTPATAKALGWENVMAKGQLPCMFGTKITPPSGCFACRGEDVLLGEGSFPATVASVLEETHRTLVDIAPVGGGEITCAIPGRDVPPIGTKTNFSIQQHLEYEEEWE